MVLNWRPKPSLAPGFNLIGSYTWNDVEVTQSERGNKGNTPFRTPEHMASLWADYQLQGGSLNGLRLGAGTRYVGSTFGDAQNSFKVDSYVLVDAMVSYGWASWMLRSRAWAGTQCQQPVRQGVRGRLLQRHGLPIWAAAHGVRDGDV